MMHNAARVKPTTKSVDISYFTFIRRYMPQKARARNTTTSQIFSTLHSDDFSPVYPVIGSIASLSVRTLQLHSANPGYRQTTRGSIRFATKTLHSPLPLGDSIPIASPSPIQSPAAVSSLSGF